MKVCVFGLWHLGSVVSASLAETGFNVVGLDLEQKTIDGLMHGKAPIYEPELDELIAKGLNRANLSFTTDPVAVGEAEVLWVTFDTPVDDNDIADVEFVKKNIVSVMSFLKEGSKVIISSQVPVGFTRQLEKEYNKKYPNKRIVFAYSPENLRLGKAISVFKNPGRIVIGVSDKNGIPELEPIFSLLSSCLEWMKLESAEMAKHAINSFLAVSVVFANELAEICEAVDADSTEVERALKTEERIGPKAYLRAGSAFSGGTLARDINFLIDKGQVHNKRTLLLNAVQESNEHHKTWVKRKCKERLGQLKGIKLAILGLAYKPDTDTLRRSLSLELCRWLCEQGASLKVYDPHVKALPKDLKGIIVLSDNIEYVMKDTDAIIVATEHSILRETDNNLSELLVDKLVIDPNGFLGNIYKETSNNRYISIGRG